MTKQTKVYFLRLLVSGILVTVLLLRMDLSPLPDIIRKTRIIFLLAGFVLLFVNTALSAWKWLILLRADGISISFFYLFKSYLISSFFGIFLPTSIGGDIYRVYDIYRRTGETSKSLAAVFIDRASGFFALATIGFIASIFETRYIREYSFSHILLPVFASIFLIFIGLFSKKIQAVILAVLRLFFPERRIFGIDLFRLKKSIHHLCEQVFLSFSTYRSRKAVIFQMLLISFSFHLIFVFIVFAYSLALNYHVSFFWFMMFIPVIVVLESLPTPTLYAVGVRDWGYVFFFSHAGLEASQAGMLSFTYLAMTVIYAAIGGILFVFREKNGRECRQGVK